MKSGWNWNRKDFIEIKFIQNKVSHLNVCISMAFSTFIMSCIQNLSSYKMLTHHKFLKMFDNMNPNSGRLLLMDKNVCGALSAYQQIGDEKREPNKPPQACYQRE